MEKSEFFADALSGSAGPLEGCRVLDISTAWAGPMVACLLGDLGAEVIHVDAPNTVGGTPFLPNFPGTNLPWSHQTVNRNKKSLAVDLRQPEGAELIAKMFATVEIVVENFKPGTLNGWGVGYQKAREVNPSLVFVSVSGYGQYGEWAPRPGYDPAALAVGGWMSLNGAVDGDPTKAPTFLTDDLTGLHGALGALAALTHARATGEGQHVDVSLLDSLLFQSDGYLSLGKLGIAPTRMGNQVGPTVPCNAYECSDGGFVYLAIALDRHWQILCRTFGHPEVAEDERYLSNGQRVANRDAVDGMVAQWCSQGPRDELVDRLSDAGVVIAPVLSFAETAELPIVAERDMLIPTTLSDGSVAPIVGPPAKFSRTRTTVRIPAPTVGQHTDEVLGAIGINAQDRERLRASGTIQ